MRIISTVRKSLFGKATAIFDLNYFAIGRESIDTGDGIRRAIECRTGVLHGHFALSDIPFGKVKYVTMCNGEPLKLILPFDKRSPGYKIFEGVPLFQVSEYKKERDDIKMRLQTAVEAAMGMNSPEQLKQLIFNVGDIIESFGKNAESVTGQLNMPIQPQIKRS